MTASVETRPGHHPHAYPARIAHAGGDDVLNDNLGAFYRSMLEHPEWNVGQIAKRLGLDIEDARILISRLLDFSLLQRSMNREGQYVAASPILAMKQLIDGERALLDASRERLERRYEAIEAALSHYAARNAPGDRSAAFESLTESDLIRRFLDDLAVQCRSELLLMSPDLEKSDDRPTSTELLIRSALARGATVRVVYPDTILYDKAALACNTTLQQAGARIVSIGAEVPMRMMIVDRQVALLPDAGNDCLEQVVLVREPNVIAALVGIYEACWAQAARLTSLPSVEEGRSEVEHQVLRGLAHGLKDETVARQMNVSVRTVRRVVADLMERCNANSRFDLGVRAVRLGWI